MIQVCYRRMYESSTVQRPIHVCQEHAQDRVVLTVVTRAIRRNN